MWDTVEREFFTQKSLWSSFQENTAQKATVNNVLNITQLNLVNVTMKLIRSFRQAQVISFHANIFTTLQELEWEFLQLRLSHFPLYVKSNEGCFLTEI